MKNKSDYVLLIWKKTYEMLIPVKTYYWKANWLYVSHFMY